MESKIKVLGHPLHPMLVVFPLGLLVVSLIYDVLYAITGSGAWAQMAFWLIVFGVIAGVGAVVPGVVDWISIPKKTRARRVATIHALLNATVLILFTVTWGMRVADPLAPDTSAILVSVLAVILLAVGGWLGGELVDRLGVGVDEGANLNAPNSLRGRKATDVRHRGRAPRPTES